MPRKAVDPSVKVIEYFETAPLPAAHLLLSICTAIVAKRLPPKRARTLKVNDDEAVTNHEGIDVKT